MSKYSNKQSPKVTLFVLSLLVGLYFISCAGINSRLEMSVENSNTKQHLSVLSEAISFPCFAVSRETCQSGTIAKFANGHVKQERIYRYSGVLSASLRIQKDILKDGGLELASSDSSMIRITSNDGCELQIHAMEPFCLMTIDYGNDLDVFFLLDLDHLDVFQVALLKITQNSKATITMPFINFDPYSKDIVCLQEKRRIEDLLTKSVAGNGIKIESKGYKLVDVIKDSKSFLAVCVEEAAISFPGSIDVSFNDALSKITGFPTYGNSDHHLMVIVGQAPFHNDYAYDKGVIRLTSKLRIRRFSFHEEAVEGEASFIKIIILEKSGTNYIVHYPYDNMADSITIPRSN